MEFEMFLQDVTRCVRERLGDQTTVRINTVQKNNGVKLSGLCIREKDINAAPTIYMEPYYERYIQGRDIYEIADDIVDVYTEHALDSDFDTDFYMDYEKVQDNIFCRLINYEMNRELLEDVPYGRFYDLAIVPYYAINDGRLGEASILIRNSHLDIWKVKPENVVECGIMNTQKKIEFGITPIMDMLSKKNTQYEFIGDDKGLGINMQVVTSGNRLYGATYMIYKEKLIQLADSLGGDYYIIPSSVHELIVLPVTEDLSKHTINELIGQVNTNELDVEEVLSNHVYMFVKDEQVLKF